MGRRRVGAGSGPRRRGYFASIGHVRRAGARSPCAGTTAPGPVRAPTRAAIERAGAPPGESNSSCHLGRHCARRARAMRAQVDCVGLGSHHVSRAFLAEDGGSEVGSAWRGRTPAGSGGAGPPGGGFSGEPLGAVAQVAATCTRPTAPGSTLGAVARVAGSGVSGRRCRTHCAVRGLVGAVLHIRPGPARGRSAESCGNTPALNAVEILPCAERLPLHMGARPLKTDVLGRTAESRGNLSIGPQGRRPSMCNTPARTGKKILRHALCVVLGQHH